MPSYALSTSACAVPAAPEAILSRWGALRGDEALSLAVDARLPHLVQAELLRLARKGGIAVAELAVPLWRKGGSRAASLIGADRDERRTAQAELLASLALAERFRASHLAIYPSLLSLFRSIEALRGQAATGTDIDWDELAEQRDRLAPMAFDRLRGGLDAALRQADAARVTLLLVGPPIWPHHLPNVGEVAALRKEFAGAPLKVLHATDWAHTAGSVRGDDVPAEPDPVLALAGVTLPCGPELLALPMSLLSQLARPSGDSSLLLLPTTSMALPPAASVSSEAPPAPERRRHVRVADACGLELRLPVGCGEIDWPLALSALAPDATATLTFDVDTTPREVEQSLQRIYTALPAPPREAANL